MRRLAVTVAVRNPRTLEVHVFRAGECPPGWAVDLIGNPAVWESPDGGVPADVGVQLDDEPTLEPDDAAGRVEIVSAGGGWYVVTADGVEVDKVQGRKAAERCAQEVTDG